MYISNEYTETLCTSFIIFSVNLTLFLLKDLGILFLSNHIVDTGITRISFVDYWTSSWIVGYTGWIGIDIQAPNSFAITKMRADGSQVINVVLTSF